MALAIWSYSVVLVAYGLFYVHLAVPQMGRGLLVLKKPAPILAAWVVSTAFWAAAMSIGLIGHWPHLAAFSGVLDTLRYGLAIYFLWSLLNEGQQLAPRLNDQLLQRLPWLALGLLLIWALAGMYDAFFWSETREKANTLVLFSALGCILIALILLEQLFRNIAPDALWNIKPLVLAFSSMFVFDFYLFTEAILFAEGSRDTLAVRAVVVLIAMPLLAIANARGRDWVSRVQLSRKMVFHSATLILSGAYLVLVALIASYVQVFGGDWGQALQLTLVVLATVGLSVLALSSTQRARLRVLMQKHFFRYRYDYRDEWLRFTRLLAEEADSDEPLPKRVIRGLAGMVDSHGGGLWLRDEGLGRFKLAAHWQLSGHHHDVDVDANLCKFLEKQQWVINLQEYRVSPHHYEGLALPDWVHEMPGLWLILPLLVGDRLQGFVVLTQAPSAVEINWEVIDLLKTAGAQAATFMARVQAAEALLEAKKFDSFNRMSAFVVHDLKNIVTQLALMLKNAERHRHNPEFQDDMLMTVNHAVEKMRQLMVQLREGEPAGGVAGVDVAQVLQRIVAAKAKQGRHVTVNLQQGLKTRGHEDRLERIIDHLVQNALDATPPEGEVAVQLVRVSGLLLLTVRDTGCGMSEQFVREQLFRPFQSTKGTGMGIGAYESAQYIKELGGKIEVESILGQGTRLQVWLPLFDAPPVGVV